MTTPYSGNPTADALSAVRFWLQDTSSTPLLSDDEIRYLIAYAADYATADPILVASVACDVIKGKYAGRAAISADGVTISAGDLQQKYADLATSLREQYSRLHGSAAVPLAGGIPAVPLFAIGQNDNPFNPSQLGLSEDQAGVYWDGYQYGYY